jgi:hypothetical protein
LDSLGWELDERIGRSHFTTMSFADFCITQLESELRQAVTTSIISLEQVSLFERPAMATLQSVDASTSAMTKEPQEPSSAQFSVSVGIGRVPEVLFRISQTSIKHISKRLLVSAHNINCITKSDAIAIAFELGETRILRAVHI